MQPAERESTGADSGALIQDEIELTHPGIVLGMD
jgi:hypothetical protein